TDGQAVATGVGEGRLSDALVKKALAGADALVTSNCTGSDRRIVKSTDPGPMAPANAENMHAIGDMLHCEAVGPAPTTTTIASPAIFPPSNVPGLGSGPGGGFGSVDGSGSLTGTGTGSGTGTGAPTGSGTGGPSSKSGKTGPTTTTVAPPRKPVLLTA